MGESRNHHFLSQCYLKGFTRNGSKNSKLFAVDLTKGRIFETTPRNVGAERDFNYIDGLPHDTLEKALSAFEGEVAKAIKQITTARNLLDEDARIHVLNLVCLFALRNPRLRESMRRFQEQVCRIILDISTATPERWESQVRQMIRAGVWDSRPDVSYEEIRKGVKGDAYRIEVPTGRHIQMEFEVFDKVLPYLVARRWMLCIAGQGSGGFITSDHPVCLMWSDGSLSTLHRPVGHGLKGTTVLFPLTSDLLLVGTFDGEEGVRNLTPFQVAAFNGLIVNHAGRQVYSAGSQTRIALDQAGTTIRISDLPRHLT